MKKLFILLPIIILAFALRWYKLDSPVADWHSWRQADTASVAWEYKLHGIDLLHPQYHDLSNIPSGLQNTQGYRMVEFPLFNVAHVYLADALPQLSFDAAGRLTAVIASLFSLIFLFFIIDMVSGLRLATLSAFIFAVLPFNIYYSRTILPEPLMSAFLLASVYFFLRLLKSRTRLQLIGFTLVSSVLMAASLLTKPYAIFFTLPLFCAAVHKFGFKKLLTSPLTYLYGLLAIIPFLLWRQWITAFPSGIPANAWLFNLNGLRFRPAWFRWLFAERLSKLILGYWGLVPFAIGLSLKPKKKVGWFYHLWFLGVLLYFAVFAGGNVTHDYYQAIIIPMLVPFIALGFDFLLNPGASFSRLITYPLAAFSLFMMLFLGWYQIREYYKINNPVIIEAGTAVDQLLPADARVIAPYQGDTAFLYQTRRRGWPAVTTDIAVMKEDFGATHYVSVNFDDTTNALINQPQNEIIEQNDRFVILKLN